MNYEKKLALAKEALESGSYDKETIEYLFPELKKESEDEKVKRILHSISSKMSFHLSDIFTEEEFQCFDAWSNAWLEKQGKSNFEQSIQDGDNVVTNEDGTHFNVSQFERITTSTTIEPKFKVGDWIVWKDKNYKVNYNGCGYELFDQNGLSTSWDYKTIEDNAHLWTIQDAKDGDVLISKYGKPFIYNGNLDSVHIGSYCGITTEDRFSVATEKCCWTENANIHPATKEQCEFLFSKMKEAGYEWDDEKKELNKIEPKPDIEMITPEESLGIDSETYNKIVDECIYGEQNPAWSEADERNLKSIMKIIKAKAFADYDVDEDNNMLGIYGILESWLKSFKDRVQPQWKPSEEHIRYLQAVVNDVNNIGSESCSIALRNLLEQLKKL